MRSQALRIALLRGVRRSPAASSSFRPDIRAMSTEAKEAKRALRREVQDALSAMNEDDVARQSSVAQKTVLSMPEFERAKRLSIYLSMPSGEARTDSILRDALKKGKDVFVPYLYSIPKPNGATGKRKVMDMLQLASLGEYESLERDSWGIPSLPKDSIDERNNALGGRGLSYDDSGAEKTQRNDASLDLIVVPGVAFDADQGRLGHGGGFYDKFLNRMPTKPFLGKMQLS